MNKAKITTIMCIASVIVLYFGISFLELAVDFSKWCESCRVVFVETSLILFIVLFVNLFRR